LSRLLTKQTIFLGALLAGLLGRTLTAVEPEGQTAGALARQALALEEQGRWKEAIQRWQQIYGQFGKLEAPIYPDSFASKPVRWRDYAHFYADRVRRHREIVEQDLANRYLTRQKVKRLAAAQAALRPPAEALGRYGYVHLRLPVRLDPDRIPEIFLVCARRDHPQGPFSSRWLLYRFNGRRYELCWQYAADDPTTTRFEVKGQPFSFRRISIGPGNGDCDDEAVLMYNGLTAMWDLLVLPEGPPSATKQEG
jgi:hypothetical protein